MVDVKRPCPNCHWSTGNFLCKKCHGRGFVVAYEIADGPLKSFLRPIVIFAFIALVAAYIMNISSKMHHDDRRVFPNPATDGTLGFAPPGSKGLLFTLVETDIPALCVSHPKDGECAAAMAEFDDKQHYGVLKCGYYDQASDRTQFHFFWYRLVPEHPVKAAAGDPRSSLKPLGNKAVQDCPASRADAEAFRS